MGESAMETHDLQAYGVSIVRMQSVEDFLRQLADQDDKKERCINNLNPATSSAAGFFLRNPAGTKGSYKHLAF